MRFSAVFAAIVASAAALVAAAPTPAEPLVARACQTATMGIARVDQAQPVASYLPGILIGQDAGQTNRKDTFAQFNVPAGSWGCQLQVNWPAGYPITNTGTDAQRRIDVFSVQAPLSTTPRGFDLSWNYCPAPGPLVGSVLFKSDPNQATKITINSFTCATAMAYRFRIASEVTAAASVSFAPTYNAGLQMVYNC